MVCFWLGKNDTEMEIKGIQQEEEVWYRGESMPLTSGCPDLHLSLPHLLAMDLWQIT